MKVAVYIIALLVIASSLSACGWRLRGSDQALDIQRAIYLAPASGTIYRNIHRSLTRKKPAVELIDADIQLVLGEEFFNRRSSVVNKQLQTTQYQLTLYITYEVLDASGKPLTDKTTAELSRYYTFDQNAITSSDKEEQSLRKEMVRQLSRRILQRVKFLSQKQLPSVE